jgi:hypothetical protein
MAFGRLERTRGAEPMSDINMTPLVDVMLVLVVIFILTAPLLASAIRLDKSVLYRPGGCARALGAGTLRRLSPALKSGQVEAAPQQAHWRPRATPTA